MIKEAIYQLINGEDLTYEQALGMAESYLAAHYGADPAQLGDPALYALSRIEADVHCTLADLAREQGLTPSALTRLLKRRTGCTFTELLHTARFNRAVTLLTESELSVADIAVRVGYENTGFFYRRFEQLYGCTPGEYRKRNARSPVVFPG